MPHSRRGFFRSLAGGIGAGMDYVHYLDTVAGYNLFQDGRPFEGIDIIDHVASGKPDMDRLLFWRKQRGQVVWKGARDGDLKYVCEAKTRRNRRGGPGWTGSGVN